MSAQSLVEGYLQNAGKDEQVANYYISALICRYWKSVWQYYGNHSKSASIEDCYDWLITSILKTLKYKPWKDDKNSLYGDPNGVDKSIHVGLKSSKDLHYRNASRKKRITNKLTVARIDDVSETLISPGVSSVNQTEDIFSLDYLLVSKYYDDKSFFELLFVAVSALNSGMTNLRAMSYVDRSVCSLIESRYSIPDGELCEYYDSVYSKYSKYQIKRRINRVLPRIRRDIIKLNEV